MNMQYLHIRRWHRHGQIDISRKNFGPVMSRNIFLHACKNIQKVVNLLIAVFRMLIPEIIRLSYILSNVLLSKCRHAQGGTYFSIALKRT